MPTPLLRINLAGNNIDFQCFQKCGLFQHVHHCASRACTKCWVQCPDRCISGTLEAIGRRLSKTLEML